MKLLFSCIGRRGYIADYFRPHLDTDDCIIGTSNSQWTPGFKACDRNYILPSLHEEEVYKESVLGLCRTEGINGLLSFLDKDVVTLSQLGESLANEGVISVLPTYDVARMCLDKWAAYQFLKNNGFETALSFHSLSAAKEALKQAEIELPLIVKPRSGAGSADTFVAKNMAELDAFFNLQPDMIIQERLVGEEINLDILNDLDGRPVSVVAWRKFRSRLGETEQSITIKNKRLLDFGVALAEAVGQIGPMDVDLFVTPERIMVLEMNPRFGGGYPVSHLAGADFPKLILQMLRGERVTPGIGNYAADVVMMKEVAPFGGNELKVFNNVLHISQLSPAPVPRDRVEL